MSSFSKYIMVHMILAMSTIVAVHAQTVNSVVIPNKDSVLIGDIIQLKVKVTYPQEVSIKALDFTSWAEIPNQLYKTDTITQQQYADIEVIDPGQWTALTNNNIIEKGNLQPTLVNGKYTLENTVSIAIYTPGQFKLLSPKVIAESDVETFPAQLPMVHVYLPASALTDSLSLNPINDIMREKKNFSDYRSYILGFGALLIVAALMYYLLRRKKKPTPIKEMAPEIELQPHEKALKALNELNNAQLWQRGLVKEYQSSLTDIIRTYLQDRYGVRATEMTTDEIVDALQKTGFNTEYRQELKEILQVADLVKFAKAVPEANIHSQFMEKAVHFVEQTKEVRISDNQNTDIQ